MKTAEDYMLEYLSEDITIKFLEEILTEHDKEIISLIDEMIEFYDKIHSETTKKALAELKEKL